MPILIVDIWLKNFILLGYFFTLRCFFIANRVLFFEIIIFDASGLFHLPALCSSLLSKNLAFESVSSTSCEALWLHCIQACWAKSSAFESMCSTSCKVLWRGGDFWERMMGSRRKRENNEFMNEWKKKEEKKNELTGYLTGGETKVN